MDRREPGAPPPGGGLGLNRQVLLAGQAARQARTRLLLIERRVARLLADERAGDTLAGTAATDQQRGFFEALRDGHRPGPRPTIQALERYASLWAPLAPTAPNERAALARLLGEKYVFSRRAVPHLRRVLELDAEPVQRAYERLYGEPLASVYAARVPVGERLRWAASAPAAWLLRLPPFWVACLLTIVLPFPQAFLALPIASADGGVGLGVAVLLGLGALNLLTTLFMAEAVARSGSLRYGSAFLGRLASDYLGSIGTATLTSALAALFFLAYVAAAIGLSLALMAATGLPAALWAAALAVVLLYLLAQDSVNLTLNVNLSLFAVILTLYGVLVAVAVLHGLAAGPAALPGEPPVHWRLGSIVGVVLICYFPQLLQTQVARLVLPRDPSGRAYLWGSVAGTLGLVALMTLWLLGVSAALDRASALGYRGTVTGLLGQELGPPVQAAGTLLALVVTGATALRAALILFNLARERLPATSRQVLRLPRRAARLVCRGGPDLSLGLTYLGQPEGAPHFRVDAAVDGTLARWETTIRDRWDLAPPDGLAAGERLRSVRLRLEVLDAAPDGCSVAVTTPLAVAYVGEWDTSGVQGTDLLDLPTPERRVLLGLLRQGPATVVAIAARGGQDEAEARVALERLVERGYALPLPGDGAPRYRAQRAQPQAHALGDRLERALHLAPRPAEAAASPAARARRLLGAALASPRGRYWLAVSPTVLATLAVLLLLAIGAENFTAILSFAGVILISVLCGVLPAWLVVAGGQKGERALAAAAPWPRRPWVVAPVFGLFVGILFLHGLLVWDDPLARGAALGCGLLMVLLTALLVRTRAFAPRLVIELREDVSVAGERHLGYTVLLAGAARAAEVRSLAADGEQVQEAAAGRLPALAELSAVRFHVADLGARELKLWAHRVTPVGDSEPLPLRATVATNGAARQYDLQLSGGQVLVALSGEACTVELSPMQPS